MTRRDSNSSDLAVWVLAGLGLVGCLGLAFWILRNTGPAAEPREPEDLISDFHRKLQDLETKLHEAQTLA